MTSFINSFKIFFESFAPAQMRTCVMRENTRLIAVRCYVSAQVNPIYLEFNFKISEISTRIYLLDTDLLGILGCCKLKDPIAIF